MLSRLTIGFLAFFAVSFAYGDSHNSPYVSDSKACATCHAKQYKEWQSSHHHHAMHHATDKTVLGNFNNVTHNDFGEKTRFFKKNGQFVINTIGSDGKTHDYQVKYTFGFSPLQQYLVELPGGKLQAFSIAWDTKNKKWFHLHQDEHIKADDPLHWTKRVFNWNISCAECHSTNLKKNYDSQTKTYNTTWSEITVGCQACHGPGEMHIEWAKNPTRKPSTPFGLVKLPLKKIDLCARCHSRRHNISPDDSYSDAFFDHFFPALLTDVLYYPGGQIKEEVYVYGSFIQSKMYRQGVTCMDCHSPHSLKLVAQGNSVCLQCHNPKGNPRFKMPQKNNYDSPEHHHHKQGSAGSKCVNCHMPEKKYMQVDPRRDHQFGIPRPDLTLKIGVPNACNTCHKDKSAGWAVEKIKQWYGERTYPKHFSEVFFDARKNNLDTAPELIKIVNDKDQANIVRATAIQLLTQFNTDSSIQARLEALRNCSVLIRVTAVASLANMPQAMRIQHLSPYLIDPVRAVRIETITALRDVAKDKILKQFQSGYEKALNEYKALQKSNYDSPTGHFNMGNFYHRRGDRIKAIQAYQEAFDLDKSFYPSAQNLASLYQLAGESQKAEKTLRDAIAHNQNQGDLYYSLALFLVEKGDFKAAVPMLKKATHLMPTRPRVKYNYALALQKTGKFMLAETQLLQAEALDSNNPDILYALTILYVNQKKWDAAKKTAERLHQLVPSSMPVKQLLELIKSKSQ